MISVLLLIAMLGMLSIFTLFHPNVSGIQSNSTDLMTNDFTNLKSKINSLISNAMNDTGNILNSSLLTNGSNLTSSQVLISKNKVMSSISSNDSGEGSGSGSSIIKDQVNTINGVCFSTKVGGEGNDTLASSGNCDDEFIGGPGADKFTCGEGQDTIRDYSEEEGDVILDRQNCEIIL